MRKFVAAKDKFTDKGVPSATWNEETVRVFGYVNLDRNVQNGVDQGSNQAGNFNVNITQNGSNLFGIQRGRSYNVRNISAYTAIDFTRRSAFLIPGNITGDSLLDGGMYVALNKVPVSDSARATAPFEAQYLKLYDVTPPPTDTAPVASKGYGLGNSIMLSWAAVSDPLGEVSGYRVVISTNPDGSNPSSMSGRRATSRVPRSTA